MEELIGKRVQKKSHKPFKSTFWVNTVKGIIDDPYRPGRKAYTFVEDDSSVCTLMVIPEEVK